MKLKRESRLVKWAYFLADSVPSRTSLCVLFWRVVLITPLKILFIGAVTFLVGRALFRIAEVAWAYPLHAAAFLTIVVSLLVYAYRRETSIDPPESVVLEYIRAKKQKVCPIIEIEKE